MATVSAETRGAVGLARLDRPEARNALSPELMEELAALCESWDEDPDVRCIVIAGGDDWFAAGADIKAMAKRTFAETLTAPAARFWPRLAALKTPLVAAVSGYALGGGCELALACDMIVASEKAELGQPEILLGIIPGGGGTQRLPRLVGRARATRMLLLGERLRATAAEEAGLVEAHPSPEATHEAALALATELAELPAPGVRLIKRALNDGYDASLAAGLAIEREAAIEALAQPEAREGLTAFLERRPPRFHE
jgi:enoyl-CoA hydratase/carnithine racemase